MPKQTNKQSLPRAKWAMYEHTSFQHIHLQIDIILKLRISSRFLTGFITDVIRSTSRDCDVDIFGSLHVSVWFQLFLCRKCRILVFVGTLAAAASHCSLFTCPRSSSSRSGYQRGPWCAPQHYERIRQSRRFLSHCSPIKSCRRPLIVEQTWYVSCASAKSE